MTEDKSVETLQVGGFQPFTTVDYPGLLAAVVFLQGCPWRCPYCHNPHLRTMQTEGKTLEWKSIWALLQKRKGLLEGVVFSGGEPTAQEGLPAGIEQVKDLGFLVGLHTTGMYPERLKTILPKVDWVGLDIKAPPDERYDRITGRKGSAELFLRSLQIVRDSGVSLELRTTVGGKALPENDWQEVQNWLRRNELPASKRQDYRPPNAKHG